MIDLTPLPNDSRGFVHKRIGSAFKGFVSSGFNPLAAVGGFIAPTAPARRTLPRVATARPTTFSAVGQEVGRQAKFGPSSTAVALTGSTAGPCPGIFSVRGPGGTCIDISALPPGGRPAVTPRAGVVETGFTPGSMEVGGAVMGRFGAALTPGSRIIDRAICLRGMVLGNDGLCYNSKGFRNSDRMWPRGRKPLLTGGEMRAISVASRAATRLTNAAVRLQDIGLIKKPVAVKRRKKK